ncbi:hypothetical protein G5B39_16975 (plasmid) [Rhodobacteraceae bacterium SC52]|nr:hypothetical protein G5B39_16975 [Rhodobacteraceae bacterium SC52]
MTQSISRVGADIGGTFTDVVPAHPDKFSTSKAAGDHRMKTIVGAFGITDRESLSHFVTKIG